MKWVWKGLILLGILLVGGLIYETVSGYFTTNKLNSTIKQYRADEEHLRKELTTASDRVHVLENTVSESQLRNKELTEELERSKEYADNLHEDNIRIGDLLEKGIGSTGRIGEYTKNIENSIKRSESIIGQLLGDEYTE